MATMYCPHCGKEIFDGLLECPNCHGPITQNLELAIDEIVEERNKKEKKAIVICGVIALMFSIMIASTVEMFAMAIILTLLLTCMLYGARWAWSWAKGTALWGFLMLPFLGWLFGIMIIFCIGAFGGLVITPKAIISWIKKKPIISKEKIIEELSRE